VKYRSSDEITRDFLVAAVRGGVRSGIMHGANLSHSEFDDFASLLSHNGLISILSDKSGKYIAYKATPAGMKYLSHQLHVK
jgi:predicted transcriptional regulator